MKSVTLLCLAAILVSGQTLPEKKGLTLSYMAKTEFSTDEGTWLSVDVSKDGSTILFDLLGDLYTLPLAGGAAKRITDGPAYDSQPAYSPDATTIAFISDRNGADNFWIAKADGTAPRQITREREAEFASPAWTPDGEYVVISRQAKEREHTNYGCTTSTAEAGFRLRDLRLDPLLLLRRLRLEPHRLLDLTSWARLPATMASIFTMQRRPAGSSTTPHFPCGRWRGGIA